MQSTNQPSRKQLVVDHIPLVRQVALRLARRLPSHLDSGDLVNTGMLGLIDAADHFEHQAGGSFTAYARIRIQGAILDELRRNDWVPRSVRNRASRLEQTRNHLQKTLGRSPVEQELAHALGKSVAELREMQRNSTLRLLVSTSEPLHEQGAMLEDSLPSPEANPEAQAVRCELQERVRELLLSLSDRDRQVVELYYFQGLCSKEIAQTLGITPSRVSQIHTRIRRRMRPSLKRLVA
ncbi:MAG: FliA/WhiG family RNA polymerase sigma factor [Myxococcota bacterium]|jgi:RNA polymerase sigma factor for flagellar operon FliA|nr:FliA/WhiG family RNA polymerase sigma factor [Myxococcota bacterium]